MNFYINRAQLWLAEAGEDKKRLNNALDRIANTVASLFLGLLPSETIEDYYIRNPSYKEYIDWWQAKREYYKY